MQGGIAGLILSILLVAGVTSASTITTINGTDTISGSRTTINTNFSNLNTDKAEKTSANIFSALNIFSSNASSTGISTGYLYVGALSTTSISNTGVLTLATTTAGCASISSAGVLYSNGSPCGSASGTVTSVTASTPNSTLSLGGTNPVTTSGTISFDINLGHANTYSALQQFANASSSRESANYVQFGATATTTIDTAGNVTLPVAGTLTVPALTSALTLTDSGGVFAEYAGATCTNQFIRSLSALGAATCATVSSGDVSLANLTATDSTLTFSGTYTGATARTIGLNLGNANTWTALQIFNSNASTTAISISNSLTIGGQATTTSAGNISTLGTLNITGQSTFINASTTALSINNIAQYQFKTPGFFYGTTTTWTATTTIALPSSFTTEIINSIQCYTDVGTLNVDIYHTTTHLTMLQVSTTQNISSFSSNNTKTASEKWYADIGTPASLPLKITCTFNLTPTGI